MIVTLIVLGSIAAYFFVGLNLRGPVYRGLRRWTACTARDCKFFATWNLFMWPLISPIMAVILLACGSNRSGYYAKHEAIVNGNATRGRLGTWKVGR